MAGSNRTVRDFSVPPSITRTPESGSFRIAFVRSVENHQLHQILFNYNNYYKILKNVELCAAIARRGEEEKDMDMDVVKNVKKGSKSPKALVVDDDVTVVRLMKKFLEEDG